MLMECNCHPAIYSGFLDVRLAFVCPATTHCAIVQELELHNNQLSGQIPENWQPPNSLKVCIRSLSFVFPLLVHTLTVFRILLC